MSKPVVSTEWASDNAALKQDTNSGQKAFGWSTSDNTINGDPVKPDLNSQNGWQWAVYQWVEWLNRTSPIFVAAADSDAHDLALAEFTCDGVNDEVEIAAAITAAATRSKEVVLLDGNYVLGATLTISTDNITVRGSGNTHISTVDQPSLAINVTGDGVTVDNIAFSDCTNDSNSVTLNLLRVSAASNCFINRILFKTGCVRSPSLGICSGLAIQGASYLNTFDNCRFEYQSIECTSASGRASGFNFADNVPANNKINLHFDRRALFADAGATNIYYQNVYHIGRSDPTQRGTHNDINTNKLNYFGDIPTPTSPPSNFDWQQYTFWYEHGDLVIQPIFQIGTGSTNPATLARLPLPPGTLTEIVNHSIQNGARKAWGDTYRDEDNTGFPDVGFDECYFLSSTSDGIGISQAGTHINWSALPTRLDSYGPATVCRIMFNEGSGSPN